jgi:hypothetical protein
VNREGNCYVSCESLYHLLGGAKSGWVPHVMRVNTGAHGTHWFLKHRSTGLILDPTARQFGSKTPAYNLGRGTGFLTRRPSRKTAVLMERMLWKSEEN